MKKFNWGHGLIIFFAVFIGLLIMVLVKSMQMDHSLVAKDYYAQDLAYQAKYEKLVNANQEGKDFALVYDSTATHYQIKFNDRNRKSGTLYFYRPADKRLDFRVKFTSGDPLMINRRVVGGRWKVSIDWQDLDVDKSYYKEKDIYIDTP